jgi:uncharacterized membrane protein YeaQ/YmgE (transglycosylase-associated protein family)
MLNYMAGGIRSCLTFESEGGQIMSILAWIVVGLIAGWLAGMVMKGGGYGLIGDLIVGIAGALLGGFLAGVTFGGDYITGFNFTTLLVSFIGSIILIGVLRMLPGRSGV